MVREFKSAHHTAGEIKTLLTNTISDSHLRQESVFRAVHDAASNMKKGVGDANIDSLYCTAHQLQRVIVNSMAKVPALTACLRTVKSFVTFVHKSNVGSAYLRSKQDELGIHQHKLIQSNATRWNSVDAMCERVVEQRPAIDGLYAEDDQKAAAKQLFPPDKRLSSNDYNVITDIHTTFSAFKEVSLVHSSTIRQYLLCPPYLYYPPIMNPCMTYDHRDYAMPGVLQPGVGNDAG